MTLPVLAKVLVVVAALCSWRGAATALPTDSSSAFVVRSAADAAQLAHAASKEGAVVEASWLGSVMLDAPLKVSKREQCTCY